MDINDPNANVKCTQYTGDRSFLNGIRDKWLRGEPMMRTLLGPEQRLSLSIEVAGLGSTVLDIPDLSGEVFQRQWENREARTSYISQASKADGALLFLHADTITDAPTIEEANEALDGQEVRPNDVATMPPVPWTARFAPTQVQVIELLQVLRDHARIGSLRLSIIISAWDLVPEVEAREPKDWLRKRLPMLYQFLEANIETFNWKAFGVSAQGGMLPDDQSRILGLQEPRDRIQVVDDAGSSHDITRPILHAMKG